MEKLIRLQIFKYGFLPVLLAMEILESTQEFELCKTILEVLQTHAKEFDIDIPTRYGEEAIATTKVAFMVEFNISADNIVAHQIHYCSEIIGAIHAFEKLKINCQHNYVPVGNYHQCGKFICTNCNHEL